MDELVLWCGMFAPKGGLELYHACVPELLWRDHLTVALRRAGTGLPMGLHKLFWEPLQGNLVHQLFNALQLFQTPKGFDSSINLALG